MYFRRFLPGVAKVMQSLLATWLMWLDPDVGTSFEPERKIIKLCEEAHD
jgi:hypothetical protein